MNSTSEISRTFEIKWSSWRYLCSVYVSVSWKRGGGREGSVLIRLWSQCSHNGQKETETEVEHMKHFTFQSVIDATKQSFLPDRTKENAKSIHVLKRVIFILALFVVYSTLFLVNASPSCYIVTVTIRSNAPLWNWIEIDPLMLRVWIFCIFLHKTFQSTFKSPFKFSLQLCDRRCLF